MGGGGGGGGGGLISIIMAIHALCSIFSLSRIKNRRRMKGGFASSLYVSAYVSMHVPQRSDGPSWREDWS